MLDYKKVTPTTTCQYNGDTMTTGLVTPSKENTETVASAAATGLFDLEMASLHPKFALRKLRWVCPKIGSSFSPMKNGHDWRALTPMILGKARIFGASPVPHVIAPQAQQVVPRQGQGTAIGGLEAEVLEASLASSGWLEPFESISYITRYHKISIYHNLSIDIIKKKRYLRRSG